jgi:hypothetical protein
MLSYTMGTVSAPGSALPIDMDCATGMSEATKQSILLLAVLLILLSSSLGSCTKAGQSSTSGGPVLYPNGWPIKELTAPPGSTRAKSKSSAVVLSEPKYQDGCRGVHKMGPLTEYGIGFKYSGTIDELYSHVEKCLASHKITSSRMKPTNTAFEFWLDDGSISVKVYENRAVYTMLLTVGF